LSIPPDDTGRQEVEGAGDGIGVRQGSLIACRPAAPPDRADPRDRIGGGERHGEALQGDVVAGRRIGRLADADGEGHAQLVGAHRVQPVIAAQASCHRREEPVVERPASGCRAALELGERNGDNVEAPAQATAGHHR
jgi:hypothetical protein